MSGRVLVVPRNFIDRHIHFRFSLSSGEDLVLHDVRKFGLVWYGEEQKVLADTYFASLGADPLELDFTQFKNLLRGHKGMMKPLLLRQDVLSGVGNIVADEVLWKAKVHPRRKLEDVGEREARNVYSALRSVLEKSIALGGSTMRNWLAPDFNAGGYFEKRSVYARRGEKCPRCASKISRITIGSRGTYLCEYCQSF
jgi:formamidopyrimidine-DNA glycosylase